MGGGEDIDRIVRSGGRTDERAEEITRLAAWIRECGEDDHGMFIEDDPYLGTYGEGAEARA